MTSFTITASDARDLARVALANASKDDFTPVIVGAQIEVEGDQLRATATDRYTVGTITVPLYEFERGNFVKLVDVPELKPLENSSVIIPRSALTWLAANAMKFGRGLNGGIVQIEFDIRESGKLGVSMKSLLSFGGRVTIRVSSSLDENGEHLQMSVPLTRGNFPPVRRLFTGKYVEKAAITSWNPELLKRIEQSTSAIDRRTVKMMMLEGNSANKPGPLHWWVGDQVNPSIEGLIQPMLTEI